ncbi:hypothetical protein GI582_26295 [Sulfitobacter sp. BDSS02]|nr:hypothetical protein [Sulfitobacter sp. BDSS02]
MAHCIISFTSPCGRIFVDIFDGEKKRLLKLTTELRTGHVAVYHGDQVWRSEADPAWSLGETAQALCDLAFEAEIPEDLRRLGIAGLEHSISNLGKRLASATA